MSRLLRFIACLLTAALSACGQTARPEAGLAFAPAAPEFNAQRAPRASAFSVIHTFTGTTDGYWPTTKLVAIGTTLYGTTYEGGNCLDFPATGCGTVFRIKPENGTYVKSLVSKLFPYTDGAGPLALDVWNGKLVMATGQGGGKNDSGTGTELTLDPASGSVAASFPYTHTGAWGSVPYDYLIDSNGTMVEAGPGGGHSDQYSCKAGCGVVLQLKPSGKTFVPTVLHAFLPTEGYAPQGRLARAASGVLYGASWGGAHDLQCNGFSCGQIYSLTPNKAGGYTEATAFSFDPYATPPLNGVVPYSGLVMGPDKAFYGVVIGGSSTATCGGAVYRAVPTGASVSVTFIYAFKGGSDGCFPKSQVTIDPDGTMYGATSQGGGKGCAPYGCGVVYKLVRSGATYTETVLYRFTGKADGATPLSPIHVGSALYGVATHGGNAPYTGLDQYNGAGVVYKINL